MKSLLTKAVVLGFLASTFAGPFNTFDGPGFPACHNVSAVYQPTSVDEMVSIVKMAAGSNIPVRVSGKGHMWVRREIWKY